MTRLANLINRHYEGRRFGRIRSLYLGLATPSEQLLPRDAMTTTDRGHDCARTSEASIARAFSSSDHRRRPPPPVITSTPPRRRLRLKLDVNCTHKPISKSGNQTRSTPRQIEGALGTALTFRPSLGSDRSGRCRSRKTAPVIVASAALTAEGCKALMAGRGRPGCAAAHGARRRREIARQAQHSEPDQVTGTSVPQSWPAGRYAGTVKANKYRRFSTSNPAERGGNS